MGQHRVQIRLNNALKALVELEEEAAGETTSTVIRKALRAYYADTMRTDAYRARLDYLQRLEPDQEV